MEPKKVHTVTRVDRVSPVCVNCTFGRGAVFPIQAKSEARPRC